MKRVFIGTLYTRLFVRMWEVSPLAEEVGGEDHEILATQEMVMAAKMVPETTEVVAVEMVLITTTNGAMKVLPAAV